MSEIFKEAAESTISTWGQWIGKSMTYGSAGAMTFFGALSSDLVFGALGVGVALAGYLLNRFYKRKEDARASVRDQLGNVHDRPLRRGDHGHPLRLQLAQAGQHDPDGHHRLWSAGR